MKLAERLLDLSKRDQTDLLNGINLPFGGVKNIIKKIDPLYGVDGTKNFRVDVDEIKREIQTVTKTVSIEITANDEQEARDIALELADKNMINFNQSIIEEDQDSDTEIEYFTVAREIYDQNKYQKNFNY